MIVGRTLPTGREIAWHEAHHAAALLVAGMTPKCVRIDWPTADEAGATIVDWGDGVTPDSARHVLIAVLLGGMAEGLHGWQEWPIDADRVPTNARRDAEQAAVLASYLKLDHAGWLHLVWKANRLAGSPGFRQLVVRIADELERVEVLDADDLKALVEPEPEAVAA